MRKKPFQYRDRLPALAPTYAGAVGATGIGVSGVGVEGAAAALDLTDASRADVEAVAMWAGELAMLIREVERLDGFNPLSSYRLLAQWARLRRTAPALLPPPGWTESAFQRDATADPLACATRFVTDHAAELIEATESLDPAARAADWIERAAQLRDSYERDAAFPRRQRMATDLLIDLDELELACGAARQINRPLESFEQSAHDCLAHLRTQPHAFVSAAAYVRSQLPLMRPDLPVLDPRLARTSLKFLLVLAAVEEMEEEEAPSAIAF